MSGKVATILTQALEQGQIKAPPSDWKIINDILGCRTAAMGGHLYRCGECAKDIPVYNSCRNRHCPLCQGEARARWLDARLKELIDTPYFHCVFTVPHELNGLFLQNKKLLFGILFRALTKTMHDVANRRLGGTLGFLSVLHSWGQKMEFHPHAHVVVPGVVIMKDDSIQRTAENYLLPKRVLSKVFRAVFIKMLVKAYKQQKLSFFGQQRHLTDAPTFFALIHTIKKKEWLVYAKQPFSGPEVVLMYLARYTHRVAISESRILSIKEDLVSFAYKDYADHYRTKTLTVTVAEFARRFLLHTLPKEFVRIRYSGFLAPTRRKKALQILKAKFPAPPTLTLPALPARTCPHCGSTRISHCHEIVPVRSPFPPPFRFSSNSHKTKELSCLT